MLDLFSDRILESEDYFRGRNGHRFVEFLDQGVSDSPTTRVLNRDNGVLTIS
jgi:hypothetical protein